MRRDGGREVRRDGGRDRGRGMEEGGDEVVGENIPFSSAPCVFWLGRVFPSSTSIPFVKF
jgi:hypothetical protein